MLHYSRMLCWFSRSAHPRKCSPLGTHEFRGTRSQTAPAVQHNQSPLVSTQSALCHRCPTFRYKQILWWHPLGSVNSSQYCRQTQSRKDPIRDQPQPEHPALKNRVELSMSPECQSPKSRFLPSPRNHPNLNCRMRNFPPTRPAWHPRQMCRC